MQAILSKLQETKVEKRIGSVKPGTSDNALKEFVETGVKFVSSHPKIENNYYRAIHDLMNCIVPSINGGPMLLEGHVYIGLWLESTGTTSNEKLARFCPGVSKANYELFADYIREDGLIPYKLLDTGPSHRQIQMVTPLARCVWNYYRLYGDKIFLTKMYNAMCRNDQWLATYRNTRGTGCVEAFCTFDTGNDASPRFWHVTDTPYGADPARYDPDSPLVPFLAPDLTANVYCQRKYLALIAEELGIANNSWKVKAAQSLESLMKYCYDPDDHFFYDLDKNGRFVRFQSDNLQRVFSCEVGDDYMFEDALRRYFLNTKKYFTRYPIPCFAIDDPGYFQTMSYNTWSGKSNYLTEMRVVNAFEYHHRYVELSWIIHPHLTALARSKKFAGAVSPWVGFETDSENFSGSMICFLDYIERYCGIYPSTEGELWFTSLIPRGIDFGEILAEETGYSRKVDKSLYEFINEKDRSSVYRDGELLYSFPQGLRLITGRDGGLKGLIGMTVRRNTGEIRYRDKIIPYVVSGNERLEYMGTGFISVEKPGVIPPNYGNYDTITL